MLRVQSKRDGFYVQEKYLYFFWKDKLGPASFHEAALYFYSSTGKHRLLAMDKGNKSDLYMRLGSSHFPPINSVIFFEACRAFKPFDIGEQRRLYQALQRFEQSCIDKGTHLRTGK